MQPSDTNTDATTKVKALVSRLVDQALARRIEEELSEAPELSDHQRIAWIAATIARRQDIIDEVTAKAGRLASEPGAPTFDLQ